MCKPSKIFKAVDAVVNPAGAVISNNVSKSNAARQIVDPTGIARQNYAEGGPTTASSTLDPGGVFTKTADQRQTITEEQNKLAAEAAYQADAPNRAAKSATDAANQRMIAMRRRRNSSALATGGTSGNALLSSTLAYGKPTFGG